MPAPVHIRPAGDRALLVDLPGLQEVLSLQATLTADPADGQVDVVAAARTVLVTASSPAAARQIAARIRAADLAAAPGAAADLVVVDTLYDGEDLAAVADLTGLSIDGVIAAHSGQTWTAAFGGFAPGFAYLAGEDTRLEVPRRPSPRTAIPAGSVALAGTYSAVYPGRSPGGWQLIGRTTARMWDPHREQPALVRPGARVRFRPVRELVEISRPAPAAAGTGKPGHGVVVLSPGLQTTVQDLGRPGFADLGVTVSGALDRGALRRANRLAGNPAGAAGLETVLGGLVLEAAGDQVVAVSGTRVPLTITGPDGGGRMVAAEAPFALLDGETLTLGTPASGLRSYVAIRGGLDVPAVLAARATDTLSGTGPAPVARGTMLPVAAAPPGSVVGFPEPPAAEPAEVTELRFVPGPRADWFTAQSLAGLGQQLWTVTPQSNRIGLRLDGTPLERARAGELDSEGTVSGAIQVPPSGLPILFLADHPVTGGYPVAGVVLAADLDKAAQLGPGARIRFVPAPEAAPVPL
ncbi:5-oxoprolinase subunit B/C family protein [Arthrobacter mobilis]|uniref:Carboxyltransferase domain-containing protein n=1 Tax=Arthrobacter mobilis TaxID=2724944 RepID=A0A7X6HD29_9MICC|nr:carboxyltransferase domain-containing protein [Arthrobacter mobilis]NKX54300.1 carboxyltransferase domain-containing protein [Arthrobacter mobilis]